MLNTATKQALADVIDALSNAAPEQKQDFPFYLPDGRDVETVQQVAAMLNVSRKVAAYYVLSQEGLNDVLYEEAKALVPAPASDDNGVAIMLYPSKNDAQQLTLPGGVPANKLHCTLGYFGKIDKPGIPDKEELIKACSTLVDGVIPLLVELNGIARFTSGEDRDPVVVTCDSPDIEDLRNHLLTLSLVDDLKMVRNHGYCPHMTVGYVQADEELPVHRWIARKVLFDTVVLGYGKEYIGFPLKVGTKDVSTGSAGSLPTSGITSARVRLSSAVRRKRKPRKPEGK